jgi:Zn-finger nucleic acid-binding protein
MASPGAVHCPTCGAALSDAAARSCPYCSTQLASIQCSRCFGTLFVGTRFCPHCGALGSQRRLSDETQLFCPRCKTPDSKPLMQPFELRTIHLDECNKCGGVWLDNGTFDRILRDAQAQADALSMLGVMKGIAERNVRYLRCPLCDQQMARHNYARRSGVIIDICPSHGLWFDNEELRRVVEFIRTGGLEEAVRADAERAAAQQQQRKSIDFWYGKDEDQKDFSVAGPAPARLIEALLGAMRK